MVIGKSVTLDSMIVIQGAEFSCKACGYTSTRKFCVKQHLQLKHTADEEIPCPTCKKVFRKELYYRRHLTKDQCTYN